MNASFGCIVLTEGRRPGDLQAALESLRSQTAVDVDVVVVGNAWKPEGLPQGVHAVELTENHGVPAGRNAGVEQVDGEFLLFLDDDARFPAVDALARVGRLFADDASLGAVSPRMEDPNGKPGPRYWVPRLRVGDRTRPSEVALVTEGAVFIRRAAFEDAGRWPGEFFFFHEGVDLAWRILEAGYRLWYAGDIVVHHPAPPPEKRRQHRYLSSRNRVWVARRNLPLPVAAAHLSVWGLRTALTLRSGDEASEVVRGYRDGLRQPSGQRKPVSWRTIWRMTRMGRPPIF
jgi:GT2 family glycosyltransferase